MSGLCYLQLQYGMTQVADALRQHFVPSADIREISQRRTVTDVRA